MIPVKTDMYIYVRIYKKWAYPRIAVDTGEFKWIYCLKCV